MLGLTLRPGGHPAVSPGGFRDSAASVSTWVHSFLKTFFSYRPVQEGSGNMNPSPVPDSGPCTLLGFKLLSLFSH